MKQMKIKMLPLIVLMSNCLPRKESGKCWPRAEDPLNFLLCCIQFLTNCWLYVLYSEECYTKIRSVKSYKRVAIALTGYFRRETTRPQQCLRMFMRFEFLLRVMQGTVICSLFKSEFCISFITQSSAPVFTSK